MTTFKGQMSDEKIQKVASYVMSLKGTNPPNAKAAQGEKCQ
jgi:cytochrome c oxidase cbb3-type subunit 3